MFLARFRGLEYLLVGTQRLRKLKCCISWPRLNALPFSFNIKYSVLSVQILFYCPAIFTYNIIESAFLYFICAIEIVLKGKGCLSFKIHDIVNWGEKDIVKTSEKKSSLQVQLNPFKRLPLKRPPY